MAYHRDVRVWHVVMGVFMAAMLVSPLPGGLTRTALTVFAVCVGWCIVQIARRAGFGVYLRLGVCGVAMLAMLTAHTSSHAMPGMVDMPTDPRPTLLTIVLVIALASVVVAGTTRLAIPVRSSGGGAAVSNRFETALEVALAGAMVFMLAPFA